MDFFEDKKLDEALLAVVDNNYYQQVKDYFILSSIDEDDYVDLYMLGDGGLWVDLETSIFIPNKTGYYSMKIIVRDDNSNDLTVLLSYYVDKRIVLIAPYDDASDADDNTKKYGEDDPTFGYCVYVSANNEERFTNNPYSNLNNYSSVYCYYANGSTSGAISTIFQSNNSTFSGALSRLESSWYNLNAGDSTKNVNSNIIRSVTYAEGVGLQNNYVGSYAIILGTLDIVDGSGSSDSDYIVKIFAVLKKKSYLLKMVRFLFASLVS